MYFASLPRRRFLGVQLFFGLRRAAATSPEPTPSRMPTMSRPIPMPGTTREPLRHAWCDDTAARVGRLVADAQLVLGPVLVRDGVGVGRIRVIACVECQAVARGIRVPPTQ